MRILIIEDDPTQLELLTRLLGTQGFDTDGYACGEEGLYALETAAYDLAILDRMLPDLDGLEVLRRYRKGGGRTPVLLLTALDQVGDRVEGLDAGADDYQVKPYAPEELLARIRALLRRPAALETQGLTLADVTLHRQSGMLTGPAGSCQVSGREGALLYLLLSNPGQVLSRGQILLRVWGPDSDIEERNIDNFVFLVRRRLTQVGSGVRIATVRGMGYRLEVPGC